MGKRRKRRQPENPAPYLRGPTQQGKLATSIDHQNYDLIDISGSDTDTDIPTVEFSSKGSKYVPPNMNDMHVDYSNHTANNKIHLNHSPKFLPSDVSNVEHMPVFSSQGSKQFLKHFRAQHEAKNSLLNFSELESTDNQIALPSRYEAASISRNSTSTDMSKSWRSRSPSKSSRSRSPRVSLQCPDQYTTFRSRSRSSEICRSRSPSPGFSGHGSSASDLSTLLKKYSALSEKRGPDVANVLKSVVSSVLRAPDVQSIISSIPAGKSRDELLKGLIEEQLTQSVAKNPEILQQITGESREAVSLPNVENHNSFVGKISAGDNDKNKQVPEKVHSVGYIPGSGSANSLNSKPEQSKLSPLGSYITNLFDKNKINYRDEDSSTEGNIMLLIDYQAKYLLRDGNQRILPLMKRKANINHDLYCGNCRQEFMSAADKCAHEKSYLHQMITGEWWTVHPQPPKYLPMFFNNMRCGRIFIWCIICFEKHGVDTNEQLFQHLKSSHHQFNMYCWKECYNAWPLHEWCLWKNVESVKSSFPRSTVNGFDWPKQIELCILPDCKV